MQFGPVILAVDDDPTVQVFLGQVLSPITNNVVIVENCSEFLSANLVSEADLFIIDVELPDGDGFDLAERVRRTSSGPIVFLTVHDTQEDRMRGLELGAIEYLSKPIHPRELQLRLRNLFASTIRKPLRDLGPEVDDAQGGRTVRLFGSLKLDLRRRYVTNGDGRQLSLTASEFEVLALLTEAPQEVMSREMIADRLGPRSAAQTNTRIIDVLIWRLRKKLEHEDPERQFITTVPLRGYVFSEPVDVE